MRKYLYGLLGLIASVALCGCQKMIIAEDENPEEGKDGVALQFNVAQFEKIPFSDGANAKYTKGTDVKMICSRINFAVYQNGAKINQINQTADSPDFGKLKISLNPGSYKVVLLAHSGESNASMSNAEKVTFDGKVTDTFYWSDDITVSEATSHNLTLKRAVAMFRLMVLDTIPAGVNLMRFYYTGGSSTFDAVKGVGCVNSRQTETFAVTTDMIGKPATFAVYTFPRSDSNALNVQVSAHNSASNIVAEKSFANVAIERNMITQYKGSFFGGDAGLGKELLIELISTDEWTETEHIFY